MFSGGVSQLEIDAEEFLPHISLSVMDRYLGTHEVVKTKQGVWKEWQRQ